MEKRRPQDIRSGDQIYVESYCFLSHGADDVAGGLATVVDVRYTPCPRNPVNEYMVEVAEHPGVSYNLAHLLEKQDELRERFGDQRAHPAPDLRPEFNEDF
jgi:hypothetical protein